MHEILTLQLGHRANYLATHFWNAQESYFTYDSSQAPSPVDHDVHFRPGIGAKGEETYTPRTLIYDLKGGFGGLRKWGGLYDQQRLDEGQAKGGAKGVAKGVWDGNAILHTDPHIPESDYQQSLAEGDPDPHMLTPQTVRYWSDFNHVFYHPRSIVQINDYELGSSLMPFEDWESGEELFMSMDRDVDLLDRDVRVWAEECDQMQGIQVYTGGDDAWGGFASRYVERLRDELGKMALWTWGVEEERGKGQRAQQLRRSLNAARTIHDMSTHASMYIPISLPAAPLPAYVHLNRNSHWHVSALLSAAVESVTLPSRTRPGIQKRGHLGDLEAALNMNGYQRIAQLQCSIAIDPEDELPRNPSTHWIRDDRVPSNRNHTMVEEDEVEAVKKGLDINLCSGDGTTSASSVTKQRGSDHVFGAVEEIRGKMERAQKEEMDKDEVSHAQKRRRFAGLPVIERYHSPLRYPLLDSFPSIFSLGADLTKVAIHTSLSTTSGVSNRVKTLQKLASQMANYDERETLSNGLGEIGEAYEEGWQSGSEDDSDD